jgi:hypothetical protein
MHASTHAAGMHTSAHPAAMHAATHAAAMHPAAHAATVATTTTTAASECRWHKDKRRRERTRNEASKDPAGHPNSSSVIEWPRRMPPHEDNDREMVQRFQLTNATVSDAEVRFELSQKQSMPLTSTTPLLMHHDVASARRAFRQLPCRAWQRGVAANSLKGMVSNVLWVAKIHCSSRMANPGHEHESHCHGLLARGGVLFHLPISPVNAALQTLPNEHASGRLSEIR